MFRNACGLVTVHLCDLIWISLGLRFRKKIWFHLQVKDPYLLLKFVIWLRSFCRAPVNSILWDCIFKSILMNLLCLLVEGRAVAHIAQSDLGQWHATPERQCVLQPLNPEGSPRCAARKLGLDVITGPTHHSYRRTKPHLVLQIHLTCWRNGSIWTN